MSVFGLIGDSHNTNRPDLDFQYPLSGPRFYSEALNDVDSFVAAMNVDERVEFILEHGDYIDIPDTGKTKENLLDEIETKLQAFNKDCFHVIGNWCMSASGWTAQDWFARITNGGVNITPTDGGEAYDAAKQTHPKRYYSFSSSDGVLFIVLDSTGDTADDESYRIETYATYGRVQSHQRTWLINLLSANQNAVAIVVFCHSWLYPGRGGGYYNVANASDVRGILEAAPGSNVLAVIQSHHHPGAQGWWYGADAGSATYQSGVEPFMTKLNGIKYFVLRCPIVGWGADSQAVDEAAANVYYKAFVKQFVKGIWDVQIVGYGNNPGGESQTGDSYMVA